jgi:Tfp pilus assembly protein PilF
LRLALPSPIPAEPLRPWQRATSGVPWQRAGTVLGIFGRPDLALPFFEDAVAADPRSASAWLALAVASDAVGQRTKSRTARAKAVLLAPHDVETMTAMAFEELEAGDVAAATRRLEDAVRRHPDDARSWALLGEARMLAKRAAEAADCFDRAVRLEPGNAFYRNRSAAARSLAGRNGPD